MSVDFQKAVIREFDQICRRFETAIDKVEARFEQAVAKLEERDESRDEEVSDLKLQVHSLRNECKRNMRRDAGLVLAPTTLTAIVTAVINATSTPKEPPPRPPPAPISAPATNGGSNGAP